MSSLTPLRAEVLTGTRCAVGQSRWISVTSVPSPQLCEGFDAGSGSDHEDCVAGVERGAGFGVLPLAVTVTVGRDGDSVGGTHSGFGQGDALDRRGCGGLDHRVAGVDLDVVGS